MHFKYIGTERAVCACPTKHRSLQWHWLSKVGQLVSIQWFSVATSLVLHHSVQPVLFVANQTNQLKDDGVYMYIQFNSHFIFILGSMMLQTLSLCVFEQFKWSLLLSDSLKLPIGDWRFSLFRDILIFLYAIVKLVWNICMACTCAKLSYTPQNMNDGDRD